MASGQKPGRSSNLFSIDHNAILATLHEANTALLRRVEMLAAALERMPGSLTDAETVEKAKIYRKQIAEARSEVRSARMADGKPFREAGEVVKEFFAKVETRLTETEAEVGRRLTASALRLAAARSVPPAPVRPPIGHAFDGTPVVEASSGSPPREAVPDIALLWEVDRLDRRAIDFVALGRFFTDASILAACRKHLDAHGPHTMPGVVYRQVAAR